MNDIIEFKNDSIFRRASTASKQHPLFAARFGMEVRVQLMEAQEFREWADRNSAQANSLFEFGSM